MDLIGATFEVDRKTSICFIICVKNHINYRSSPFPNGMDDFVVNDRNGSVFFVHPIHPELTWLTIATRQLALTLMLDSSDWLQMVSQGRLNEYFLFFSEKWFHQQFLLGKMSVVNSEIYVYLSCLSLKITWRFPIPIVYSIHVWYMHLHLR